MQLGNPTTRVRLVEHKGYSGTRIILPAFSAITPSPQIKRLGSNQQKNNHNNKKENNSNNNKTKTNKQTNK